MFKGPIQALLFEKFPSMANSHFGSMAEGKADKQKFNQTKELKLLQDQLAQSEAEREAQRNREKEWFKILNESLTFSQDVLTKQIANTETRLLEELQVLRRSIDRLARSMGEGRTTTQEILLQRIEDTE